MGEAPSIFIMRYTTGNIGNNTLFLMFIPEHSIQKPKFLIQF